MENNNLNTSEEYQGWGHRSSRSGRVFGGLLIMAVGAALLAYQLNMLALPRWVFTWKVLLILIGLFSGFRHSFRNPGWIFPVLIGGLFLVEDIAPHVSIRPYFWPILIIICGLIMMLKPSPKCQAKFKSKRKKGITYPNEPAPAFSKEDYIDGTAVFGGIKKNIITKDFKGGVITTFCGGTEYNLTHADIQGEVTLEVTQVFGGTRLVLPAHWKVRSEMVAVFGGIEDKRPLVDTALLSDKVLVLKGTLVFGGIDIKSY